MGEQASLEIFFTETVKPIMFFPMLQVTFDIIVTADADPNSLDRIRYATETKYGVQNVHEESHHNKTLVVSCHIASPVYSETRLWTSSLPNFSVHAFHAASTLVSRYRICCMSNDIIVLEEILGYVLEALDVIEVLKN